MPEPSRTGGAPAALTLGALGVVFGDIGTSPLYAIRECFVGTATFAVDRPNVLGILSLITWALVVIVALKYVVVVLQADNQGEGGILALAHLVVPHDIEDWTRTHSALVAVGLFGAALLFGDGIITPALSVLSAVEGLAVATPRFEPVVVPLTLAILVALFAIQRFGTGRVGTLFGPVMLLWFGTLGVLGVGQIWAHPGVLAGLDPRYGVAFFANHGLHGTLVLGAVFLAVTGAEAMYADLGHFGRAPIRNAWFGLVFPALLVNYFGQGALLLDQPEVVDEVFYRMAPEWALYPLVGLATLATIIASQAVISGVFSLTAQAVQLEYFPRTAIQHTSASHHGQIYVPAANGFLLVGTVVLVLGFQSSTGLASAYGIAVSLTMLLTTVLLFFVARDRWGWPVVAAVPLVLLLGGLDLAFVLAIARKVMSGGWIPLTIAVLLVAVMAVWRRGRQLLRRHPPQVAARHLPPTDATRVFLVRDPEHLHVSVQDFPDAVYVHVHLSHRPYLRDQSHGEIRQHDGRTIIRARFGFMERPHVPALIETLSVDGDLELTEPLEYILVHETFPTDNDRGMPRWMKRLYDALAAREQRMSHALGLPEDRTVEVHPPIEP